MWDYLYNGGDRAIGIWHRRGGKDELALHWASVAAHRRVGTYWHMLPEAAQAKKAIWRAVDPQYGIPRIDVAFPHALRKSTNNSEMFIEFLNGSTWQVVGSDNFNSLVGSPPVGIVFSEWAIANPQAWAYLRPILRENGGWAIFITTSRGQNHAATMYKGALNDESWYADLKKASETGVFTDEQLKQEEIEYKRDYGDDLGGALFKQEYECSFQGAVLGAFYGKQMQDLLEQGKITSVPYDPNYPVHTSWDLGMKDSTVIVYWQKVGTQKRAIDCDAFVHTGMSDMLKTVNGKPYSYLQHKAPHDIGVEEIGSGRTRREVALSHGCRFDIAPRYSLEEGIGMTRQMLPRCVFDAEKCRTLVDALCDYHAKWDIEKRALSRTPDHNWASDYADAVRYEAILPTLDPAGSGPLDYSELDRVMV